MYDAGEPSPVIAAMTSGRALGATGGSRNRPRPVGIRRDWEWRFDAALEAKLFEALKQAAIEEGQWSEKREINASADLAKLKARINRGRDRLAALARGEEWYGQHQST